jgi:predicted ferric reductase
MTAMTSPTRRGTRSTTTDVQARARIAPGVALGVIAAGAIAVIALWWRDTPAVHGLGDWLTNAGRITGLGAGYAVVVLLALMARIPALERGVGTDRLVRWHAMGGRYTVCLASAHAVLITWGYAVLAHTNVVHQTTSLILTYPDVLMGTVALGLLITVGIVSARAARRHLRYETWHFVHLYTYLAVALAFSHQFSTGASFMFDATARVLWSAMYVTVAALLLWFRVITPVRHGLARKLRVAGVVQESPDIVSVYITGRRLEAFGAEPGQFFRWRFLTRESWWAANPYSLSAAPRPDMLRITVRMSGDHSRALANLKPGTKVWAEGPYGGFTSALRSYPKVLLIAGGVGIAPLRALLESIPAKRGDLTLIYRATTDDGLALREEIDKIAAARHARVYYLVGSRTSDAAAWLAPENLRHLVPDVARHDVYLCGPDGLVGSVEKSLRSAGVPRARIHHESFTF